MEVLTFILNIVLFLVSLGVLITIHELGHFMTAKLFKVYCIDFSIGFGPKLFKYKKKGGETTFSLGSIPLGGYVLMYGEGSELPGGVIVDESRSLEGIKKWKKAIVLSSGIILNLVLGMVLFLIANTALPYYQFAGETLISESSPAYVSGLRSGDRIGYVTFDYKEATTFIVDSEVTFKESTYVLCFYPDKIQGNPILEDGITLYEPLVITDDLEIEQIYKDMINDGALMNLPDLAKPYPVDDIIIDDQFEASLSVYVPIEEGSETYSETPVHYPFTFKAYSPGTNLPLKWNETKIGISFTFNQVWRTFGQGLKATWDDFAYANTAVFRGIGMLFTGSGEVSGLVGIFSTSSTVLANYGFGSYLFLWGLISVNLAIFNLLPFPGLDGWQLLVTAIEGISRKKVPTKVKSIISAVGLVLLFGLMIFITIKDILGLF